MVQIASYHPSYLEGFRALCTLGPRKLYNPSILSVLNSCSEKSGTRIGKNRINDENYLGSNYNEGHTSTDKRTYDTECR